MDYDGYIGDRIIGMYALIESSDSICLEGFKDKKKKKVSKEEGEKARRSFINFAKKKDPKKGAELEKEPSRVKQAINQDWEIYKEWRDAHPAMNEILVLYLFGLIGVGMQEVNRRQARKRGK